MSTTTLRLPDDLKARIAEMAERAGTTPHHFMLEAVAEKTAQAEQRAEFEAIAEHRYARLLESGQTVGWQEMREYLQARAAGQSLPRPVARERHD